MLSSIFMKKRIFFLSMIMITFLYSCQKNIDSAGNVYISTIPLAKEHLSESEIQAQVETYIEIQNEMNKIIHVENLEQAEDLLNSLIANAKEFHNKNNNISAESRDKINRLISAEFEGQEEILNDLYPVLMEYYQKSKTFSKSYDYLLSLLSIE